MFRLTNAEVKPLTRDVAIAFRDMEPSPTEREMNPSRITHLLEKAAAGQLVTFHWSTAKFGNRILRMNGQHSSSMLCTLNGTFPEGLMVHLDEYEVDTPDGLASLFRQFDDRKSSRSPADVAGAYQGLVEPLKDVKRPSAKLGAEGYTWYQKEVQGLPTHRGDGQYSLFFDTDLHGFLCWLGDLLSVKTPELKPIQVIAALYATFSKNETEAKAFWNSVARGGVEFEDNAPATVLDKWLKDLDENKKKRSAGFKPAQFYQGCIYAWNAFREQKTLSRINSENTKKGLLLPHE
jgi:hypothetical protein